MKKITLKSLLIIALAIIPMAVFAQSNDQEPAKPNNNHYWSVGFDEGATLLFGDNKSWDFQNVRPEIGVFGGFTFAKHFTVYGRVSAGTVKGKLDKVFKIENASFLAADLNLAVDLVSLIGGYNPDRVFGLTPHVGFGQMQYQARATVRGEQVKYGYNDANGNKGKGIGGRKVVWDVPMGVRFDFNINRNVGLYLDVMTNYTDTDRLDAYASGKHYDWFSAALIGFKYNFRKADPVPPCYSKDELDKEVEDALKKYQEENPAVSEEEINQRIADEVAKAREAMKDNDNEGEDNYELTEVDFEFEVGNAEVKDSENNKNELQKINDEKNNREISNIKVEGYASPEGNDDQNVKLSQHRADAAVKYIKKGLGEDADDITFESKGMGSDWEGLAEAVRNSKLTNKEEILKAVEAQDTQALNVLKEKNPELKNLLIELRKAKVYINK